MPTAVEDRHRSSLASSVRALVAVAGLEVVASILALLAGVLALAEAPAALPLAVSAATLALAAVTGWQEAKAPDLRDPAVPTGSFVPARVLIVITVMVLTVERPSGPSPGTVVLAAAAAFVLSLALVLEPVVQAVGKAAQPYAANLPGVAVRNFPVLPLARLFGINSAAVVVFAALALSPAPPWSAVLPGATAAAITAAALLDGLLRVRQRQRAERRLRSTLAGYGATFILYWDAPHGSSQQIEMWLPYLARLKRPFLVVLRNPETFVEATRATDVPVLVRRYVSELDVLITPGLKTAFFVNTAPKNAHMVHFLAVTAIQLNHGDSDKAPSYRRVFRMYDKNFVAGQAAVDRFADHGVVVPRDAFEIVGRPQVESVEIEDRPIGTRPVKRVLYAPTWYGYLDDSRYCSLAVGLDLVRGLIARGCEVTFRPHPWTERTPSLAELVERIDEELRTDAETSGRAHRFGREATGGTIISAFNSVDAMVADVSSVVSDFLYSEKPFAITSMEPDVSGDEFTKSFPLARAGYVLSSDLANLDSVLDDLLSDDPAAEARRRLKTYYLGDFPADRYADGFLDAARPYV